VRTIVVVLSVLAVACGPGSLRQFDGGGDDDDDLIDLDAGNVTAEPCNGIDDDGDGFIDMDANGNPLRRSCQTDCGTGNEYCESGEWVCYAPAPHEEVCDNFDNDCDGEVDEGCDCRVGDTQECGHDNVGVCHRGSQTCQGDGKWSTCVGAVDPGIEACGNGLDDDCDGETDETCGCTPGSQQACGSDVGQCTPGSQTCSADGAWGACTGAEGPFDEQCNGLDDNCDGTADEFWAADDYEQNDTCERHYWLGELDQDAEPVVRNDASLFATGDEDWYQIHLREGSNWCVPGTNECAYEVTFQLTLEDGMDPDTVELCAVDGACANVADTTRVFCTHGSNWYEQWNSYLLSLVWGGVCGRDDSKDWQIVVRTTGGTPVCGYYGLAVSFERVDQECPN